MKKTVFKICLLAVLGLNVACTEDSIEKNTAEEVQNFNQKLLSPQQINDEIKSTLQQTGQFYWKNASLQLLWSASQHGQNLVTIGYGTSTTDFEKSASNQSKEIVEQLLNSIQANESNPAEKLLIYNDPVLNIIDVIVKDQKTLYALRNNKNVRYVEPADYRFFKFEEENGAQRSSSSGSSGCGFDSQTLSTADYTSITPNAKVPWSFYKHNIPNAWSKSTGSGITIGVIDSGVSPNQSLLGSNFNNGDSNGRSVQKYGTYVDSIWPWSTSTDGPNDQCGHGTSMTATATAPRNNKGLPVGVAYNANLISYRAAANVVLEGYHEQKGVQNAFVGLGNNSSVKIISMSMGHIFSVGRIEDGVRYANNRGKLIFCAGGTSTSFTNFVGVIFPAWMNETVAVTGIKEGSGYNKCSNCHSGSKIDFTVVMERSASGNTAPVLSYYENQTDYVGGSSVATATTAGIAALVWSKNPSWTKDQVLNKLKQSASLYPNRSSEYGYGNINAALAVQ
ncbi:S8/S53 family peptidase [Flavobacterium sp. NRK F7]|uniref:S8 family peptidase n=1 Tax=Flavobacterium sp. NRK F7 TaxID=2954930 RepID=UPI002090C2B3|nr:S8/S53 family peptidase [Flavobacterium sp. NRK F7]MCO6162847.1 S8/S53 family peptidase [Flavobacterium sp. NRK F7]